MVACCRIHHGTYMVLEIIYPGNVWNCPKDKLPLANNEYKNITQVIFRLMLIICSIILHWSRVKDERPVVIYSPKQKLRQNVRLSSNVTLDEMLSAKCCLLQHEERPLYQTG